MTLGSDPIGVIEAAYQLRGDEREWLVGLAAAARALLGPGGTVVAYHVDLDGEGARIRHPLAAGDDADETLRVLNSMRDLLDANRDARTGMIGGVMAGEFARVLRAIVDTPSDRLLLSEQTRVGPDWAYTLGAEGSDAIVLQSRHIDPNGATVLRSRLGDAPPPTSAERTTLMMLSAHIKAGLRLRRRLADVADPILEADAILNDTGRVVHAEGAARSRADELEAAAAAMAWARSDARGRSPEAVEVWQGLVAGRWSLVEQTDVDGKRLILAVRNEEGLSNPRGLGALEARTLALIARGYSTKVVAYHLGIASGSVSAHVSRGLRKLGLESRLELLRVFGSRSGDEQT